MSKDLSLLRPFNPQKALEGETVCTPEGVTFPVEFNNLRMAPLCWLEDKPVYKGDILYRKLPGTNEIQELIVQSIEKCMKDSFIRFEQENQAEYADNRRKNLSWTKPKQKKQGWINVYPDGECYWRTSKGESDSKAADNRIACVPFEYEVD